MPSERPRTVQLMQNIGQSILKLSQVPEGLKIALVKPIPKSNSLKDYQNYRPISILPVIDKIMEKYVAGVLMDYAQKYNHISNNQYGFQQNEDMLPLKTKRILYTSMAEPLLRYGLSIWESAALNVLQPLNKID
ncbi:hypothetical protein J437_LFUL014362 [Ladona fulva]|uniref:Reverse transcriptase domain-containing protein n=1 Tax=Ladona fulva TaxID=123851 RepID=A0A8K0P2K0_LADFU|nr:hypothetical protein J437_LFUL014362 [Ladona fulva]